MSVNKENKEFMCEIAGTYYGVDPSKIGRIVITLVKDILKISCSVLEISGDGNLAIFREGHIGGIPIETFQQYLDNKAKTSGNNDNSVTIEGSTYESQGIWNNLMGYNKKVSIKYQLKFNADDQLVEFKINKYSLSGQCTYHFELENIVKHNTKEKYN